jgi:hypothetical protein
VIQNFKVSITVPILVFSFGMVLCGSVPQHTPHDSNRPEAVPVLITRQGFTQMKVSLPAGIYTFVVVNRTGFQTISVSLERVPGSNTNGPAAKQEFIDRVGEKSSGTLRTARLTPGNYRLRVEGRPDWISEINVR